MTIVGIRNRERGDQMMVVLVIFMSILFGLMLTEVVFRVFKLWAVADYSQMDWYHKVSIPGVPYQFKPNLHSAWGIGNVSTDDFGLRNNHPATKPPGIYRILMLGDSVTFGYGVDQTQSFPYVLERLLNQGGALKYQVIDAGVPGYSIVDESALLPALLDEYNPNLVVWTVTSNDYDDSLGVGTDGRVTAANSDYVIDANHIAQWGHNGRPDIDVDDFRRSMVPRVRASTEEKQEPRSEPGWLNAWMGSHLLVYSFLTSHAVSIPRFIGKPKPTEVELLGKYKTTDGREYLMQFFSAVYSSRHAIERSNQAIERARELSEHAHIPIILINDGLPIDSRWMTSRDQIVYQDLSDYLGESPVDFFFHNNLGWDSHPSPRGNRKIAQALRRLLGCLGYVPRSGACFDSGALGGEMRKYWSDFEKRRQKFVATYYGPIDLDRFRGIHQF